MKIVKIFTQLNLIHDPEYLMRITKVTICEVGQKIRPCGDCAFWDICPEFKIR